ncbi:hypothetical protein FJ444_13130 [Aestuariibacter sp. GS-14]|uniref:hypothetical protein n=1 Tax=Aestuariibacter sp. GS-14 TaxID=2590670 RepID=UPI0011293CA9|nr:hypothetical protein [Aestuariibacter sp. GS-14]TPV57332.1 hypothetical protein FJ444_13130 [Aestuariibacter sp. GS-14]
MKITGCNITGKHLLLIAVMLCPAAIAQVPEQCVQAPERTSLCPHTLYRIAKAPIPALDIPQGGMVCLCLSDLTDLPLPQQPDTFKSIASHLQMPVADVFMLLEVPVPDWAKK